MKITAELQQKRLDSLKEGLVAGMFADLDRKKKIAQLEQLIKSALFLRNDENRRSRWLAVLNDLDTVFLENLARAIIRENLRFKKHERDIVIELNHKASLLPTHA